MSKAGPRFLFHTSDDLSDPRYIVARNSGEAIKKWRKSLEKDFDLDEEDTPDAIETIASEEDGTLIL